MKKIIKIIILIIVSIVCLYALFLTEESIRIEKGGDPLIVLNDTCNINEMPYNNSYEETCHSLGFKIKKRYVYDFRPESDVRIAHIIEEEFWLFNKFLIWSWIS